MTARTKNNPEASSGTRKVAVSTGGDITLGAISFQGYIDLKQELIDLLSGPVAEQIVEILSKSELPRLLASFVSGDDKQWTNENTLALVPQLMNEIKNGLPGLVRDINRSLDSLSQTIVDHCVRGELPEDLTAIDWLDLREAAFEVSQFERMLEREKNFLAGIVDMIRNRIGSNQTSPRGTSDGNQSSRETTVGAAT